MSMHVRTGDWPPADRIERWREEFGRHVIRADVVACGPRPESFDVDLQLTGGTDLAILQMELRAVRKVRDASWFGDGADSLTFMFCRTGQVRYDTADRRAVLRPGEATLFSHRVPVALEWDQSAILTLQLPAAAFRGIGDRASIGRRIAGTSRMARLLRAYAEAICATGDGIPALAERHLTELARAAVAMPEREEDLPLDAASAGRLAAVRALIARHARRPGFGLHEAARALGVSIRTLQRDFAAIGSSLGDELLEARLQIAYRLLAEVHHPRPLIGDVALDAGFGDLSHFNRQFRTRFGCTPSDIRSTRR